MRFFLSKNNLEERRLLYMKLHNFKEAFYYMVKHEFTPLLHISTSKCYYVLMQPDIQKRLDELERKIDAVHISVEKIRNYIKWTAIITIIVFVVPVIGLVFAIPAFLRTYVDTISTLGM